MNNSPISNALNVAKSLLQGAAAASLDAQEVALRSKIVTVACSQIGVTDASKYWLDAYGATVATTYAWCGVFDLWVLRQAGLTTARWCSGPKVYGFIFPLKLMPTFNPQPGDVAYFTHNQHHALVVACCDENVVLCNGNGAGGAVTITTTKRATPSGYFSVRSLIRAKLEKGNA